MKRRKAVNDTMATAQIALDLVLAGIAVIALYKLIIVLIEAWRNMRG